MKVYTGYKVFFLTSSNRLSGLYRMSARFPRRKWFRDLKRGTLPCNAKKYRTGFHIFVNKEDALEVAESHGPYSVVYQVKYRKVVARGDQECCPIGIVRVHYKSPGFDYRETGMVLVDVAREIYVEKQVGGVEKEEEKPCCPAQTPF